MKSPKAATASLYFSITTGAGSTNQIFFACSSAFSPENKAIASFTAFSWWRKSNIFPYGLVSFRTRLVREKACISP